MKKILMLLVIFLVESFSIFGAYPVVVKDQIGREVKIEKSVERIVSSYYISSASLIALGLEDKVVGIEMKGKSRNLYRKAAPNFLDLPEVGSGKGINIEEIAKLNPDLVIVPFKLRDSIDSLEKLGIKAIVVNPENLESFKESIKIIGMSTDTLKRAEEFITYYDDKILNIKTRLKNVSRKPKVYLGAGSSYLSTCTKNMYQDTLIRISGGINVSSSLKENYWTNISREQLLEWNPEYIFVVNYAKYSLDDVKRDDIIEEIEAIKNNKIYDFPSDIEPWDYPTPSSILGIMWLSHILYPNLYSEDEYIEEASSFYNKFFDIVVSKKDIGIN